MIKRIVIAGCRNYENYSEAKKFNYVILFWDGKSRGTKSMLEYAKRENKPVRIKYI